MVLTTMKWTNINAMVAPMESFVSALQYSATYCNLLTYLLELSGLNEEHSPRQQ